MKKLLLLLMAGVVLLGATAAFAGDTATQTVTFTVATINEISVSGDPGALLISTTTAGSNPDSDSDASTTYSITTNEADKKITGIIDSNMPAGLTLTVTLAAPAGAASAGAKTLSDAATDLVTGIANLAVSGKTITYGLAATPTAVAVAGATRTVTLTVLDGS